MACTNFMEIKQFCCCCPLRTGCLIIGYLGLIGSILSTAAESAHFAYIQSMNFKNPNATYTNFGALYTQYMSVGIAYYVISIIFNGALIWGIHKNYRQLVLPWLIVKGFELILSVIAAIFIVIFYIAYSHVLIEALVIIIVLIVIAIWLTLYCYMCVYSFYIDMSSPPRSLEIIEDINSPPSYIKSFYENKKENFNDVANIQNV